MQAYGTVASTVLMFIFTLASAYVYLRGPESEYWDIYCPFSLGLGFLGLGLFGVLGVLSIRFRNGLRNIINRRRFLAASLNSTASEPPPLWAATDSSRCVPAWLSSLNRFGGGPRAGVELQAVLFFALKNKQILYYQLLCTLKST